MLTQCMMGYLNVCIQNNITVSLSTYCLRVPTFGYALAWHLGVVLMEPEPAIDADPDLDLRFQNCVALWITYAIK